jgi:hypothetical protein
MKNTLQDVDYEVHGCEIVVEEDYVVQGRFFGRKSIFRAIVFLCPGLWHGPYLLIVCCVGAAVVSL